MVRIDGYRIEALTPDRWEDFEAVLGRGGIGGCWCMYWLAENSEAFNRGTVGGSKGANKAAFRQVVDAAVPGLLAYEDAGPVAWVRVMDRARHPGLARSRLYPTDDELAGIWSISCFVVRWQWRGRGLMTVLIRAAVQHARAAGARVLEAYPTDSGDRRSPMAFYRGSAATFRRLGFTEVQRRGREKPMLRLTL